MHPREMLSENLSLVRGVVRLVAWRRHLTPTAAEDLESTVWVRLMDHDYRAVRQYRGQASLRTFLTVVVSRLLVDAIRTAPRGMVAFDDLLDPPDPAAADGHPDQGLESERVAARSRQVSAALARAVTRLSPADRRLLRLRHAEGMKVSAIARMLNEDQTRLYRRLNVIHKAIRRVVEAAGVTRDDARAVTGRQDVNLESVL
jgi:RNA polymerase sigma factor (sigma-70 family)